MIINEKLVEQHIREYESRLKHIDEQFECAKLASAALDDGHAIKAELGHYHKQRIELANQTAEIKKIPFAHWREDMILSAGPMGVWDILAQQLEDLIERIEN
jgi:hypothetical protein